MECPKTKIPTLACAILTLSLVACGGSSGGGTPPSEDQSTPETGGSDVDYSPVSGLYDTSVTAGDDTDEHYVHISSNGELTAYNYLGDSVDAGDNCYREAETGELNAAVSGKTLEYDQESSEFTVELDGDPLYWRVEGNDIIQIGWRGISGGSGLNFSSGNIALRLEADTTDALTISDIEAAMCAG